MTIEEKLDRLTGIVETLAGTIVAHDRHIEAHDRQIEARERQIEALLKISERQSAQFAALERQWQAYINTLPRQ